MPALPSEIIVQAIEEAFTDSAASAVLVSKPRGNPKRFYVTSGEASFSVWIYIWTLTHGGGPRSVDEYRIQLTSVTPPFAGKSRRAYAIVGLRAKQQVLCWV